MERSALIQKIKIRMDELTPLGENITHPFDESFNSILDEAHRQILNEAPVHLLPMTEIDSDDVVYDTTNDVAYVKVPDNFIRVASLKFSDWTNPATQFISQENPQYKVIEHGLIVRNVVKPMVVLLYSKQDDDTVPARYLKCYSVEKEDDVDPVEYLYCITEGDVNLLPDKTTDALAWLACAKLMQTFEMQNYKIALDRYNEFIITNAK